MFVIRSENRKMLIRIANSEDPEQTAASSEAVCSGSAPFILVFWQESSVQVLKQYL